jgi:hypothetical protein
MALSDMAPSAALTRCPPGPDSRLQLFDAKGKFKRQWTGVQRRGYDRPRVCGCGRRRGLFFMGIRRADFDTQHTGVLKLDSNWNITASIAFGQPGDPVFNAVHNLALGRGGSVYVPETRTKRVVKLRPR